MSNTTETLCFFCDKPLSPLASRYLLAKQRDPKAKFVVFGYACEPCGENKPGRYRTWKGERP